MLGSCIAICHFVLPFKPKAEKPSPDLDGRYGDEAMKMFDRALKLHQTDYKEYQAKIFGGGNMFGKKTNSEKNLIGERNAAKAMQLLMERGIEISVVHVGEQGHCRIVLDITTGNVWVKHHLVGNPISMQSQSGLI